MNTPQQPIPSSCTCESCPGPACACGCQQAVSQATNPVASQAVCACGPQCACGAGCTCPKS